jgi:phosphoribosylamine--glycine ligase
MMRLESDLVELCEAALDKRLDQVKAQWDHRVSLGVVMAAGGYPDDYNKGDIIKGLPAISPADEKNAKVFHAGTAENNADIVTAGGRVLCVVALGDNITKAQASAYKLVDQIHWDRVYYRTDIGHRAISREN